MPVFFLDRCLGRHLVARGLRKEGLRCEVHDDHLAQNATDEEWIKFTAEQGWIVITKDKRIRNRTSFLHYLNTYSGRVFVISTQNNKAESMIECIVNAKNRIMSFIEKNEAPFIASIYRNGSLKKHEMINRE